MASCFIVFTAAALLITPLAAQAQPREQYTYRCVGKDGKKHYGQTIPNECLGMRLEMLNQQGFVVKRIDPEGDEKARLAKEEEAQKKRDAEAAIKDSQRRSRALLATYTSEKDIQDSRERALVENKNQMQEVEGRIAEIKKRKDRSQKELELFKSSGKGNPPERLKEEINIAELDLKAQESVLLAKKKDADVINARYDEDLKRYRELTGRSAQDRAREAGIDKGVTVTNRPATDADKARAKLDAERRAAIDRAALRNLEREREAEKQRLEHEQRLREQRAQREEAEKQAKEYQQKRKEEQHRR
jgi:hypothetical protein